MPFRLSLRACRPALVASLVAAFLAVGTAPVHAQQTTPAAGTVGVPRAALPVLRPGDVLRLRVWPDQALSGDYPIDVTGSAFFPLLGEIHAADRTITEVRADMETRYRALVQNSTITLNVAFKVGVLGAVARPGLYIVDPTNTVLDVISLAGGFAPHADDAAIRLVRGDQTILLTGGGALTGDSPALSLVVQSGDRIVVPERPQPRYTLATMLGITQMAATLLVIGLQLARR